MAKTYSIVIPGDPEKFISRVKKLAEENNAVVTGDNRRGSVSVIGIKGSYRVEKNTAFLTIETKPFYIPWCLMEKEIRNFFGGKQLVRV